MVDEYEYKKRIAESRLVRLQQLMVKRNPELNGPNVKPTKKFEDYIMEQTMSINLDDINRAVKEIESLPDKEAKLKFFSKLPKSLRDEVVRELQKRKTSADKLSDDESQKFLDSI
jgi:hypothetical protein